MLSQTILNVIREIERDAKGPAILKTTMRGVVLEVLLEWFWQVAELEKENAQLKGQVVNDINAAMEGDPDKIIPIFSNSSAR